MLNHLTENIIEQYLLSPEALTPGEKTHVEAHINGCALCREHLNRRAGFLNSIEKNYLAHPTGREKEFVERTAARKRFLLPGSARELSQKSDSLIGGFAETVEPYKQPLPHRFVRFIRFHPYQSAGVAMGLAAALVGLMFLIKPIKDTNISYARAKDEFLVAYNSEGGELWRKHIGVGYDMAKLRTGNEGFDEEHYLATIDVNGDGKNDVVALFGRLAGSAIENQIACFNSNGDTLWKYEFHRNMTFGNESISDDYYLYSMIVGDFSRTGKPSIVALANHKTMFPSSIISLDAKTGKFQSEYWHCGNLTHLIHADLNHDGTDEIIAGGENNSYNLASLIVFDSRKILGSSPALPNYTPQNRSAGEEKYYLLFSRSDLQQFATNKRNSITNIFFRERGLEVRVSEAIGKGVNSILYNFDSLMRCTNVEGQDQFAAFHIKMENEGKLTRKIDIQYYETLRKGVQYRDGEKLVNTPTMNENYKTMSANR